MSVDACSRSLSRSTAAPRPTQRGSNRISVHSPYTPGFRGMFVKSTCSRQPNGACVEVVCEFRVVFRLSQLRHGEEIVRSSATTVSVEQRIMVGLCKADARHHDQRGNE